MNPIEKLLDVKFMALYKGVVIETYSWVSSKKTFVCKDKTAKSWSRRTIFSKFVYKDN